MGAYVQWVPDRRLVVVRYIPATPPPTEAPPPPVPEETVAPPPPPPATPNPLKIGGYVRSYYFTRQNASNNPGAQFNFSPGAKYSLERRQPGDLEHGDRASRRLSFPNSGWHIGGTYFYANPTDGPCVVPANHREGRRLRVASSAQHEPRRNASRLHAEYVLRSVSRSTTLTAGRRSRQHTLQLAVGQPGGLAFEAGGLSGRRSRLYESGRLDGRSADMLAYGEPHQLGVHPSNAVDEFSGRRQRHGLRTSRSRGVRASTPTAFGYGKVGYSSPTGLSVNGYFYGVSDLANMWWGDGKYTFVTVAHGAAVHRPAGRHRKQRGAIVYRQDR